MVDLNLALSESHNAPSQADHVLPLAVVPEDEGAEPEGAGPEEAEAEGEEPNEEAEGKDEESRCIDDGENAAVMMPDDNNDDVSQSQGCCSSALAWFSSNAFLIYASQFLSAWGDRMWTFAVALYLVEIEDYSLRLTAIFGFALTLSVLLFGTLVGQWVDRTPRLTATRKSLVVQNLGVIINAICLLLLLHYKAQVMEVGNGVLFFFCQVIIIILGVVANLASVAEKICIQKDWVVILAGDNRERLAEMNATIRRIDLSVNILAPIIVGQIMTFASMTVAGIFIAAWNLCSLILEFYLLLQVYKKVPRLALKFRSQDTETAAAPQTEALMMTSQPEVAAEPDEGDEIRSETQGMLADSDRDVQVASEDVAASPSDNDAGQTEQVKSEAVVEAEDPDELTQGRVETTQADPQPTDTEVQPTCGPRPLRRVANWFLSTYHGWLTYKSYPVYLAGLALAFLYMTVMGFDSITNGYGYSMGLSEAMIGVIRALGSVAGIVGTFLFPRFRQRIGVTRTGLYSLSEEILCLTMCICSIWAAGSPFDPHQYFSGKSHVATVTVYTTQHPFIPTSTFFPTLPVDGESYTNATSNPKQKRFAEERNIENGTTGAPPQVATDDLPQDTPDGGVKPARPFSSYASPILFFTGMVTSRVGLWMFDLVTTQLIQENVREDERGVFNGVQRSLECSMDMLHFILVILLPSPQTFGYLIIVSFVFICFGAVFYCVFAFRDRGHLFHPEKLAVCIPNSQNRAGARQLAENDA